MKLVLIYLACFSLGLAGVCQCASTAKLALLSRLLEKSYNPKVAAENGITEDLSQLNMDLVREAAAEYQKLSSTSKVAFDKKILGSMVVDLAVIPSIISADMIEDEQDGQMFVNRLIKTYKILRPGYMGDKMQPAQGSEFPRISKMNRLFTIGSGDEYGELSIDDWMAAKREYESGIDKLNALRRQEDVYSNLYEFQRMMNMKNNGVISVMGERVFPLVERNSNPDVLIEFLRTELVRNGYSVKPLKKAPKGKKTITTTPTPENYIEVDTGEEQSKYALGGGGGGSKNNDKKPEGVGAGGRKPHRKIRNESDDEASDDEDDVFEDATDGGSYFQWPSLPSMPSLPKFGFGR